MKHRFARLNATLLVCSDGHVVLIALNLSLNHPIDLALDHKLAGMQLIRLQAPGADVKTGETLGDATIGADGSWQPKSHETAGARLHLPVASGALIF